MLKDIEMDSRNHENHLKKHDEKSLEKLQSRTVFADPSFNYTFKKTEKITAALYLITNLISDNEPIKWQIRKVSLDLLSDMLSVRSLPAAQSRQIMTKLTVSVSELVSLLKVASVTDHISSMNYSVIQHELALLMTSLESLHPELISGALLLPQDFFAVQVPPIAAAYPTSANVYGTAASQGNISKGHYRTSNGIKDNQAEQLVKDNLKDNRRETIVKLLKAGKPLAIKDFAKEIKDCSEKTLQRELLAMVENGVLKKTGERRWSVYSLA